MAMVMVCEIVMAMVMVCEIVMVMVMAHNTVANLENIATGGPAIHELVIL